MDFSDLVGKSTTVERIDRPLCAINGALFHPSRLVHRSLPLIGAGCEVNQKVDESGMSAHCSSISMGLDGVECTQCMEDRIFAQPDPRTHLQCPREKQVAIETVLFGVQVEQVVPQIPMGGVLNGLGLNPVHVIGFKSSDAVRTVCRVPRVDSFPPNGRRDTKVGPPNQTGVHIECDGVS